MKKILLVVDKPRLEERMIEGEAAKLGLALERLSVEHQPLPSAASNGYTAVLVRTVSMYNALYAAAALGDAAPLVVNRWEAIIAAGDKALTYTLLARHRIPHPETLIALTAEAARRAAEEIGYPLVDKPPIGSWGRMVALLRTPRDLEAITAHREAMPSKPLRIHLIQEYVETGREDVRCIVVGERLLGCIKRRAREGEWRSNVALGAATEPYRPTPQIEDLALRAARAIGAFFASIDIFEHPDRGPLVNEVNATPEYKGFMRATGVNVARELLAEVLARARR